MAGRITLVGAGELLAAMSRVHRDELAALHGAPRPVFLDTTAGYETNVDAIAEKAVEYYQHHLQTNLGVARFHHKEQVTASETAAAIAEVRSANLLFAGPGSPSYAIRNWRDTALWDAVLEQFEGGAHLLFASAAAITTGRHSLPVYEIYKAGEDPFWIDGLDILGRFGLNLAVIPHFNDNSGGENYDTRFCYLGARRFDALQELLPPDVAILGIDAYTAITFDVDAGQATISGQGGITLIGDGEQRHYAAGASLPFAAFQSASRKVIPVFHEGETHLGYVQDEDPVIADDPIAVLCEYVESLSLAPETKIEALSRVQALRRQIDASSSQDGPLVDLALELRRELREAKRFDLADRTRDTLIELGYDIRDTPQGSTWERRES